MGKEVEEIIKSWKLIAYDAPRYQDSFCQKKLSFAEGKKLSYSTMDKFRGIVCQFARTFFAGRKEYSS